MKHLVLSTVKSTLYAVCHFFDSITEFTAESKLAFKALDDEFATVPDRDPDYALRMAPKKNLEKLKRFRDLYKIIGKKILILRS